MTEKTTSGETHGCIVCGTPFQLYVVRDPAGRLMGATVMSAGGRIVPHAARALVACDKHSQEAVEAAVNRVYGPQKEED